MGKRVAQTFLSVTGKNTDYADGTDLPQLHRVFEGNP